MLERCAGKASLLAQGRLLRWPRRYVHPSPAIPDSTQVTVDASTKSPHLYGFLMAP